MDENHMVTVKILLIGTVLYSTITRVWGEYKNYGDEATQEKPLFGIYNVTKFVRNKDTLPLLSTDTLQWKQLDILVNKNATIKMMNDSLKSYNFIVNSTINTVTLFEYSHPGYKSILYYFIPDATHHVLAGKLKDDSVYIVMKKIDIRLINRGFQWINEHP